MVFHSGEEIVYLMLKNARAFFMFPLNSKKNVLRKIASVFPIFSCYPQSPVLPAAVRKDTELPSLPAMLKISRVRLRALCLGSKYLSLV